MPRTEAGAQRDAGKPRKEATEEETGLKASNEGGVLENQCLIESDSWLQHLYKRLTKGDHQDTRSLAEYFMTRPPAL